MNPPIIAKSELAINSKAPKLSLPSMMRNVNKKGTSKIFKSIEQISPSEVNSNLLAYEDLINKAYFKIKELHSKSEFEFKGKSSEATGFHTSDDDSISILNKLESIYSYIRLVVDEKIKFYTQTKQEVKNIDDILNELRKSHHFDQVNFKRLIDKVKISIQTEKQDSCYIESLKQNIIKLEREKSEIIEISRKTIETLKADSLEFIKKLEIVDLEKTTLEKSYKDLLLKTELVEKKEIENRQLKKEIEYLKGDFIKEKTRIAMLKEKEMKEVTSKLKYIIKLERENNKTSTNFDKLQNKLKEEILEKSKVVTVSLVYYIVTFYKI